MRNHKSIPLTTRNKIVEYSESINLANPNNVSLPSIDIAAIEGLEIFSGWRCQETSISNPFTLYFAQECAAVEIF